MKQSELKLLLLVIFVGISCNFIACAFKEADLRYFEALVPNATKHVNFDKLRIKKVNKTHHLFLGELEVFNEFGNDYKVSGLMFKAAGNDYKLMPYKLPPLGWCEFIKSELMKKMYLEFKAVSDFPEVEDVS